MELNAKPIETNIVLIHDRILIALFGANNIKPVLTFTTGWELNDPDEVKEFYAAYRHNLQAHDLIEQFEQRKVNINLKDYLDSVSELEGYVGEVVYGPTEMVETNDNK